MATKKISELEEINQAENDDYLVVVDTSESKNKKITKENFLKTSTLEEKISDLENNQLTASTEGTSIDINDSADYQVREMIPNGNTTQNGTPTPTNPVLIKNAGDAKNLYYLPEAGSSDGITYSINEDGTINLSGTATANATFPIFKSIAEAQIENGATYTFSSNQALPSGVEFRAEAFNGTSWLRHLIVSVLNNSNRVFTGIANLTDATRIRHLIYIASGTTVNLTNLGIQFEKGNTQTSFTPEGKGFINETISNKNLFNKSTILEKHLIDSSGNITSDNNNFVSDYIGIDNNLQYKISAITNSAKRIAYYNNSKTFISRQVISDYNGSLTIPTNTAFCRLSCHNDDLSTLQLEVGESASTYIEHQEQVFTLPCQQPMRSIGNVRDSFVKIDGVWYERHVFALMTLNGTDELSWSKRGSGSSSFFSNSVLRSSIKKPLSNDVKANILSDTFENKTNTEIREQTNGISIRTNGDIELYFNEISNYSVTTFESWLSTHNINLIYELNEPIDLECTQEQITALEALEQARTYKPVTHISSADVVPAYLGVTYVRDLETVINNLS